MAGGFTITAHDPRDDTDEQIAERHAFSVVLDAEAHPEDPPSDLAQAISGHRSVPDRWQRRVVTARDADGSIVGLAAFGTDPEMDANPDLLRVNIRVHPDHRRQGIGTQLLAELTAIARRDGRTRLMLGTSDRVPAGEAAAVALGAARKQQGHTNRLAIADVDRAMLETWVAAGPVRAAGYELIAFDGRCPDEHVDGVVHMVLVMNTAPRDDLQVNDFTFTPQELREHEQMEEAAGLEGWVVLVRHVESGEYAGMHDVYWSPTQPATVWVGLTAVDPPHRGHAIGKWMKAVQTLRILDERPDVVDIRTQNMDSNDAMLGINHLMGYRPYISESSWELPVEAARAWLADRGVVARADSFV